MGEKKVFVFFVFYLIQPHLVLWPPAFHVLSRSFSLRRARLRLRSMAATSDLMLWYTLRISFILSKRNWMRGSPFRCSPRSATCGTDITWDCNCIKSIWNAVHLLFWHISNVGLLGLHHYLWQTKINICVHQFCFTITLYRHEMRLDERNFMWLTLKGPRITKEQILRPLAQDQQEISRSSDHLLQTNSRRVNPQTTTSTRLTRDENTKWLSPLNNCNRERNLGLQRVAVETRLYQ